MILAALNILAEDNLDGHILPYMWWGGGIGIALGCLIVFSRIFRDD